MEGEDQCDIRFRHITEITILTVQLIVEFAKRLPGFDKLLREDQIALLKVIHLKPVHPFLHIYISPLVIVCNFK